tara:strand:+ start:5796 stop:6761 length:966 start_codon:yes stop_codon:yes gene_type:complete
MTYCKLTEHSKKNTCSITTNKHENSDLCEYNKEKKKCYTLKKKLSNPNKTTNTKKKDKKVNKPSVQKEDINNSTINVNYNNYISLESVKKYKKIYKDKQEGVSSDKDIVSLHAKLKNNSFKKNQTGLFWIQEQIDKLKNTKEQQSDNESDSSKDKTKTTPKNKKDISSDCLLPDFNEKYYELINVDGDGNCGYHSFIKAMLNNKYSLTVNNIIRDTPDKLRKLIVKKLARSKLNADISAASRAKGGIGTDHIPDDYWMDSYELQILATTFKTCVHIWEVSLQKWTLLPVKTNYDLKDCLSKQQNIFIYADGIHFQVITRNK